MLFEHPISNLPFITWLQERENRRILLVAFGLIIIQFVVFKFIYPDSNFMSPDSTDYINAAYSNAVIDIRPIGYPKFLRLFSSFTNSDLALVSFQYLLVQTSLLYLLFSLRYLLAPGKWLFRILLICCILNPLLPHISNFVSSDALFLSLSLLWFTQILWLIYLPTRKLLIWHAIILLLAFMVRYSGLYYPFISSFIIIFSSQLRMKLKVLGLCLIVLLLSGFIGRTQYAYDKLCNKVQFSPFSGWQLASNALYAYAHAKRIPASQVPPLFRALHEIVNRHMDSLKKYPDFFRPDYDIGVYYLWNQKSPLKQFIAKEWKKDSVSRFFKNWAFMAPIYSDYGWYLIKHRPGPYLRHYLWRNLVKFYAPPPGFIGSYNLGKDAVNEHTIAWFGWKSNKIKGFNSNNTIEIANFFQVAIAIINVLFLISFIGFAYLGGFKNCNPYCRQILWWTIIFWICNMIFSVFSAPIELRYQLFPMILSFCLLWHLLAYIIGQSRRIATKSLNENLDSRSISESLI